MFIVNRQRQREIDCLVAAHTDHRLDRRAFLQRAVAAGLSVSAASSFLASCSEGSAQPPSIDILNVWSGEELESFKKVVEPFEKATGITINLESTRNLSVALTIRLRGNDPPGVAVVPNPPQMRQMASQNQLIRLDTFLDMRQMRSEMIETLSQDYIRTARAKGLSRWRVIYRHALGNAINPLVTLFGFSIAFLLGGALLTEYVFGWPGLGLLIYDALTNKDEPLVMAAVTMLVIMLVIGNLIADILLAVIDPRIRVE